MLKKYREIKNMREITFSKSAKNLIRFFCINGIVVELLCILRLFLRTKFTLEIPEINNLQTFMESDFLTAIVDFSSLAFDFGYMQRNVIYYQFDKEEYFKKHYIKGYFDYDRDGFGPVVENISDVIKFLYKVFENKLNVDKQYNANSERFFPIRDSNNCQRIFELLINKI